MPKSRKKHENSGFFRTFDVQTKVGTWPTVRMTVYLETVFGLSGRPTFSCFFRLFLSFLVFLDFLRLLSLKNARRAPHMYEVFNLLVSRKEREGGGEGLVLP